MVTLSKNLHSTPDFPQTSNEHLFFKRRNTFKKVAIEDIIYVEAEGDYTMTYTDNGRFLSTLNLKELEDLLSYRGFFRTHRSYLANLNFASNIDTTNKELDLNGYRVPYSRRCKKKLMEQLQWV